MARNQRGRLSTAPRNPLLISKKLMAHSPARALAALLTVITVSSLSLQAANQTWDGGSTVNGNWSTILNWNGDVAAPGATSGTTNADVATFNAAIANTWGNAANNPIVITSGLNISGISFTQAAGNYFIGSTGGNAIKLTNGGTLQILSGLTATNAVETVNAPLALQGTTYTFANNSANGTGAGAGTLNIGGGITGTTGATVLTLSGSNANANTVSGVIDDGAATSLGITKSGAGTWVLSGANTFTGATTISGGTLSVSAANNLGAATADVTINGGTLHIDSGGTMGTVNSSNRTVTIGSSGATLDFVGNQGFEGNGFTGTGTVTKTGAGIWTVSTSASSYTGAITVSAGVLRMTFAAFTAASITVQSGAQLYILDNSDGTWDLGTGGKFTLNGDGGGTGALRQTLQSGGTGVNFTSSFVKEVVIQTDSVISAESSLGTLQFASVVSGTGTITKAGVGTLNFAGTGNTLSGGTIIQGGTITVSSGSLLGTGLLTMSQTGTNNTALTLSNAAQSVGSLSSQFAATTGTISQTITLTGTALTVNQSVDGTYGTGAVSTLTSIIAGTGSLIKAGSAKLTLTGVNTYTGATTLTAGTLSVGTIGNGGVSGNMGAATNAAANLVFNGGTLQYTGATASTDRNFTINAGKTATFDITTNSLTISGSTTATTGALTKIGSGTLILSGINLHTGVTNVTAGTLQFAKVTALYNGTTASWTKANILVSSGATLAFNVGGTGEFTTGNVTTLLSNLTSSINNNGLMSGATLAFDTTNASGGTFTIADNIANSSGTGGGALGLTKLGGNTLVLSGTNSYTGTTTVVAGVLALSGSGNPNNRTSTTLLVNLGATLRLDSQNVIPDAAALTLDGGTFNLQGNQEYIGTLTMQNAASVNGTTGNWLIVNGTNPGNIATAGSGNAGTISADLAIASQFGNNPGARTQTFNVVSGTSLTVSGAIVNDRSGTGNVGALTKTGAGTLTLFGVNTYTGGTTISAGTLQIGAGGTTGSLSTSSSITDNGTLAFNRSDTVTQGTHFASVITGTGGVTQAGSGTVVLSGANTYSGSTVISTGTLLANNSSGSATGSGGVSVAVGAVLAGTGRVNAGSNAITINGALNIGDTTLATAVSTDLELGTTGGAGITLGATGSMRFDLFSGAGAGNNTASLTASDLLILYGDISLLSGASLIIDNPNNMSAWAIGDQWRLWDVTNAGNRTGSFALANIIAPLLSVDKSWSFDSNSGILSIVPEPGRACLLLLGMCGLLLRRRR